MVCFNCRSTTPPNATLIVLVLGAFASLAAGIPRQQQPDTILEASPRGDLVRRESHTAEAAAASLAERKEGPADDAADVKQDGTVTLVAPVTSSSEKVKLEELTEECMHDLPTAECMEKFGSYGVKKLYTETWENVVKLGYLRQGWMSHPEVQKKKLFEVTLPGTASSGTYAITGNEGTDQDVSPFGVVAQNFDVYKQLELGIRMLDLRVAYSTENKLVYVSHGSLMVPLATVLRDIRRFLEEHEREVIVIDVRKDENADISKTQPFVDEEQVTTRIPGQLVHEAVQCELKEMVATYAVLSQLPTTEAAENPTIGALTDIGANVIYFWETQQVLCTSYEECTRTPGWFPYDRRIGFPFAFGPPFSMNTRVNASGSRATARMIEPACMSRSGHYTKDAQPEKLAQKLASFSLDMTANTALARPKCFPVGDDLPQVHKPTVWYTLESFVTLTKEEQAAQQAVMQGVKAVYTRGEGFTVKTDAERANYLVLNWFLKRNNQHIFTKPNAIMFEFAGSALMNILRIIESNQGRPECGWAIHCKESDSCWANSLLGKEDMCIPEGTMMQMLKDHADGTVITTDWVVYSTIGLFTVLFMACICSSYMQIRKLMNPLKPKEAEEPLTENAEGGIDTVYEEDETEEVEEVAAANF